MLADFNMKSNILRSYYIYSGMNVRIVYESSTTSNVVGLSVRHNNTRIHVRVRQEVGYRQHGGMILCQ